MQTKREALKEAIEQATEKVADVVDMPRAEPRTIQLTKAELLEFENLGLKEALAKSQLRDTLLAINEKRSALADAVTERVGTDVKRYAIDPKTGTGRLPEKE